MSRAKKSLGQNFLVDPNLQRKIVDALDPEPEDHVLEIGPGGGALTHRLGERVERLILIELDDELVADLRVQFAGRDDVEIIHGDVLSVPLDPIDDGGPIKVIGNIPYNITSPLIFHLLGRRLRPGRIVLTIQKEVADRLVARPGTKDYGALSVGVRALAQVERLFRISPAAFRPRPDVDSAVVRLTPIVPSPLLAAEETALRTLTRAAFGRRRKQLQKILRQAPEYALSAERARAVLGSLGIDPSTRPDALPVEGFLRLAAALALKDPGGS